MREVVLRSVGAVAITLVGLLGIAAFLHILVTLPFPDNKGAEWVGAIGTVGTLIGTIWIASDAQRRSRRAELDLAMVTAAKFIRTIPDLIEVIEAATDRLRDGSEEDPGYVYYEISQSIANTDMWSNSDLATLVVLPNRAAAKLALAKVDAEGLVEYFDKASTKVRMRQPFDRDDFEGDVLCIFNRILEQLDDGREECVTILLWE